MELKRSAQLHSIGDVINDVSARISVRPRYSVVFYNVCEKFEISINTYVVIDSVHKLSTSDPKFPYCIMSKSDMATFLKLSERTVYRALSEAEEKGLIERHPRGLRASPHWIRTVEIYSIKS